MKFRAMSLLFAILLCGPVFAQESETGTDFLKSVNLNYRSKYLGGNGGVFHPSGVEQGDVTLGLGAVDLNFWGSNGSGTEYGDEINITLLKGWLKGSWNGESGIQYIDAKNLFHGPNGDVFCLYSSISHRLGLGLTLTNRLELYQGGGHLIEGGVLNHLKLSRTWQLGEKIALTDTVGFTTDDGAFGFNPGGLGTNLAEFVYKMSPIWSLSGSYRLSDPIYGAADRDTQEVWSVGTSFNF